jgi:hypothetical protein
MIQLDLRAVHELVCSGALRTAAEAAIGTLH